MRYDAFISYAHDENTRVIDLVQRKIERFAIPLYNFRGRRVFRDRTALSAQSNLWQSISTAISASKKLVLFSSKSAAASVWVDREIEAFLSSGRTVDDIVLVLLDGEIQWSDTTNEILTTPQTALPDTLLDRFEAEPLYVDLRWMVGVSRLNRQKKADLTLAVATIVAAIEEVEKDTIWSADLRHRQVALTASSSLSFVFATMLVGLYYLFDLSQENEEEAVRQLSLAQTRESMLLASRSLEALDDNRVTDAVQAALLALPKTADQSDRPLVSVAQHALYKALLQNRLIYTQRIGRDSPNWLIPAEAKGLGFLGTTGGSLSKVDLETGTVLRTYPVDRAALTAGGFAKESNTLVIAHGDPNKLVALDAASGEKIRERALQGWPSLHLAVSESRPEAYFVPNIFHPHIRIWNYETDEMVDLGRPTSSIAGTNAIEVSSDGHHLLFTSKDGAQVWSIAERAMVFNSLSDDGNLEVSAGAPDGNRYATFSLTEPNTVYLLGSDSIFKLDLRDGAVSPFRQLNAIPDDISRIVQPILKLDPSNRFLVANTRSGDVRIFDLERPNWRQDIEFESDVPIDLVVNDTLQQVVFRSRSGEPQIWSIPEARWVTELAGHALPVRRAYNLSGGRIATLDDEFLHSWDLSDFWARHRYVGPGSDWVLSRLSRGGKFGFYHRSASKSREDSHTAADQEIIIWDLVNDRASFTLDGRTGSGIFTSRLDFSSDERYLLIRQLSPFLPNEADLLSEGASLKRLALEYVRAADETAWGLDGSSGLLDPVCLGDFCQNAWDSRLIANDQVTLSVYTVVDIASGQAVAAVPVIIPANGHSITAEFSLQTDKLLISAGPFRAEEATDTIFAEIDLVGNVPRKTHEFAGNARIRPLASNGSVWAATRETETDRSLYYIIDVMRAGFDETVFSYCEAATIGSFGLRAISGNDDILVADTGDYGVVVIDRRDGRAFSISYGASVEGEPPSEARSALHTCTRLSDGGRSPFKRYVVSNDGRFVYVNTPNETFVKFDLNFWSVVWEKDVGRQMYTMALSDDGQTLFGTGGWNASNGLFGFSSETGEATFSHYLNSELGAAAGHLSVLEDRQKVIYVDENCSGIVVRLDDPEGSYSIGPNVEHSDCKANIIDDGVYLGLSNAQGLIGLWHVDSGDELFQYDLRLGAPETELGDFSQWASDQELDRLYLLGQGRFDETLSFSISHDLGRAIDEGRRLLTGTRFGGDIANDVLRRGRIGIRFEQTKENFADVLGAPGAQGVIVLQVARGSVADTSGLQFGDIISGVNGVGISGSSAFRDALSAAAEMATITFEILRNGSVMNVELAFD